MNSDLYKLESLIERCRNHTPRIIIDEQIQISYLLSKYYEKVAVWNYRDLYHAMKDGSFNHHITMVSVSDHDLKLLGMTPLSIPIKKRSKDNRGWYVPFVSTSSLYVYKRDMSRAKRCISML